MVLSGSMSRSSSGKKSIMKKPQNECQYAQLIFEQPPLRPHFASDDSVLYINNSSSPKYQTNYATIDHSRRHNKHSKINSNRSSKGLMHSASCPFKVNFFSWTCLVLAHSVNNSNFFFILGLKKLLWVLFLINLERWSYLILRRTMNFNNVKVHFNF